MKSQTELTLSRGITGAKFPVYSGNASVQQGPRLLVSVRSVTEAQCAIVGGAEILDVKEPARGSLGMAPINEIIAITQLPSIVVGEIPLSVALGEVVDWACSSVIPTLPAGITFAKLGLSRLSRFPEWRADWCRVRTEFDEHSLSALKWVAVAYADSAEAGSPCLSSVVEAATETGCAGLLIDTWTKGTANLFDYLDVRAIAAITNECRAAGLFVAIAGRLNRGLLHLFSDVSPDIVAIRSAACLNSNRVSELDAGMIVEFRGEMRRQFVVSVCG